MVNKIIKYMFNSKYRFFINSYLGVYDNMSDVEYLSKLYFYNFGMKLNIDNPHSFNEKLQWLKLYDRKPIYTDMVDKYESKMLVKEILGKEYIIPNYGVWDRFEDIDFDKLPNQFVLKCTHDSGGLIICRDKTKLNIKKAKTIINKALKRNYYFHAREWPYKNVKPRIIAEQFMQNNSEVDLTDYKFYCFNGEPKFLYISKGLENHATASISFVNLDWTFAPYLRNDYKPFEELPKKPCHFDKMIEIARILSRGTIFLRVDLYDINDKIYFSELTFSPGGGLTPFASYEQDLEIGKLLELPINKKDEN